MSLRLTTRDSDVDLLATEEGRIVLAAEKVWVFDGPPDRVAEVHAALAPWAERVGPSALRVRFGNHVGVIRVPGLPTFEVVTGKWKEAHFESMLAELTGIAAQLPFSGAASAALPYERSTAAERDVLYTAFVYLRHILSEAAPDHARLTDAIEAIVREPHRALTHQRDRVPLVEATRVDASSLVDALTARDLVKSRSSCTLAKTLKGRLPQTLVERRGTPTFDTAENRFVLAFLEDADQLCREMAGCAGQLGDRLQARVLEDVRWMRAKLEVFLRHRLWSDVGRMTVAPLGSTVLQRRRGYREVYQHSVRLRLASTALPIGSHQARDLLESRNIATLYELWCYFKVVEAAKQHLGEPARALPLSYTDVAAKVKQGFEVVWPGGIRVAYNADFRKREHGLRSYSLPMRPDISLVVGDAIHLLDAKFRVVFCGDDESIDFKDDDLWKMHGYRDSIVGARSAWVLYPGTEYQEYLREDRAPLDGVGAVPLVPEPSGADQLVALLKRLLEGRRGGEKGS